MDLALKDLEGWVEAVLVEMEKSYRGKVQSGSILRVWKIVFMWGLCVCAHCKCVCRGYQIIRDKWGKIG